MKILWIKYRKWPFNTSKSKLWQFVQPGDFELAEMGGNNRYVVTTEDQDAFDKGDFFTTDSKSEMRMKLDIKGLSIGKRYGYSDCYENPLGLYSPVQQHQKEFDWTTACWVGYMLKGGVS